MQLIHEFNKHGWHRILVRDDKGNLTVGKYASYDSLAVNGKYRGASPYWDGTLPLGIFEVRKTQFTQLADNAS